jgi:hypothetical protein
MDSLRASDSLQKAWCIARPIGIRLRVHWNAKPSATSALQDGTNDGGVHDLFVITCRSDATGSNVSQTTFTPAGNAVTDRAAIRTSSSGSQR